MEKSEYRILIADDDEMVREVIVKFLSEQGYSVMTANDGHEAIKCLRLEDVHLVLTDLKMPGADGMEVLRTAVQINPRIAVVLLTAYGTLDTALEAVNEGAYNYLSKPFVMQQLLLIVRNAYRMTLLMKENEKLANHLREAYKNRESSTAVDGVANMAARSDSVGRIEKLKELNLINADEARVLKERLTSGKEAGDENIRKYSSLVKGLKKEYK